MERATYEAIVQDAIDALPEPIKEKLADVAIVIDEGAPPKRRGLLLGLYEGVPLTVWGRDMSVKLPDKISLFTQSIERVAESEEAIADLVRETLWHEIAHYFGFDHDRIGQMEKRWREKRQA
jgi:predicted Zn-dependent protease with MMP-like domain